MSSYVCPQCGMVNVDCGKDGYKTAREMVLEEQIRKIKSASIRCPHLVLDECSLTAKNCIGLIACRERLHKAIKEIEEYCNKNIKTRANCYGFDYTVKSRPLLPIQDILNKLKEEK